MQNSNLTILLQGPITQYTRAVVDSMFFWFPESKIVLSTWRGSDVEEFIGLKGVELVLNNDPGAISDHKFNKKLDNVNRQILSTYNGLVKVDTEYVIKSRTDIEFISNRILDYYRRWQGAAIWFDFKILMVNYNFKHPDSGMLFHPSDLVLMGRTKDIINYYTCKPRNIQESRWLEDQDPPIGYKAYYQNLLTLHTAESYLLSQYLLKCGKYSGSRKYLETCFTDSKEARDYWEESIPSNFIVVDPFRLGIRFRKYPFREFKSFNSLTYSEWKNLLKGRSKKFSFDLEKTVFGLIRVLYMLFRKPVKSDY